MKPAFLNRSQSDVKKARKTLDYGKFSCIFYFKLQVFVLLILTSWCFYSASTKLAQENNVEMCQQTTITCSTSFVKCTVACSISNSSPAHRTGVNTTRNGKTTGQAFAEPRRTEQRTTTMPPATTAVIRL